MWMMVGFVTEPVGAAAIASCTVLNWLLSSGETNRFVWADNSSHTPPKTITQANANLVNGCVGSRHWFTFVPVPSLGRTAAADLFHGGFSPFQVVAFHCHLVSRIATDLQERLRSRHGNAAVDK